VLSVLCWLEHPANGDDHRGQLIGYSVRSTTAAPAAFIVKGYFSKMPDTADHPVFILTPQLFLRSA